VKQCVYEGPYSEEIYDKNQRKESWKVHSVGYNAVAGSMFIRLAVVGSKISEIKRDSLKTSNW